MGTKATEEKWYLVTDQVGYVHRICLDNEGVWGSENIMHFVDGTRQEKHVLTQNFLNSMLKSTENEGEFFGVKWVCELV